MPEQFASDMPRTRARAVADALRASILTGEYRPGDRLRQIEIAARFGVSTTPVREAFTMLSREGLILQDPHRGVIVFEPSIEDVRENYEIRSVLESLAGRLAATRITDEQLAALDALVDEMRTVIRADPARHTAVLNPRFHSTVYAVAGRPRLAELIHSLRGSSVSYLSRFAGVNVRRGVKDAVQHEHEQIVLALHARDPDAVAAAICRHLDRSLESILAAMHEHDPAVALDGR
jgi:DNA-binding GntR family transcriptional regulator